MQCGKKGDKFFRDFQKEFWRRAFTLLLKRAKSLLSIKFQFAAGDAPALQRQITDKRELITKRAAG